MTGPVRLIPGDPAGRQPFPCLSCTTRGLQCLLRCLRSGELLPPLFTLTCAPRGTGGLFSVALAVRRALGARRLPLSRDALPCGVRTFLYRPKGRQRSPEPERRAQCNGIAPPCRDYLMRARFFMHGPFFLVASPGGELVAQTISRSPEGYFRGSIQPGFLQ